MLERIIIRTISNLSYAGTVVDSNHFEGEGIVLLPNKMKKLEIFIPKSEIQQIIAEKKILSFQEFKSKNP